MKQKEVKEGNRILGEFDYDRVVDNGFGKLWYGSKEDFEADYDYLTKEELNEFFNRGELDWQFIPEDSLMYHSSWDWLMNIWDKIESLGYYPEICNNQCRIYDKDVDKKWKRERLFPNYGKNNKEAVFKTFVQFVKWYKSK